MKRIFGLCEYYYPENFEKTMLLKDKASIRELWSYVNFG